MIINTLIVISILLLDLTILFNIVFLILFQLLKIQANGSWEQAMFNDTKLKKLPTLRGAAAGRSTWVLADNIKDFMLTLSERCKPFCDNSTDGFQTDYKFIYVDSTLPHGCSNLNICNSTTCVNLEFRSMFFSRMYRRSFEDHLLGIDNDPAESLSTRMCSKLKVVETKSCDDPAFCCKERFLPFNIPGHRFEYKYYLIIYTRHRLLTHIFKNYRFCTLCPIFSPNVSGDILTDLDKACKLYLQDTGNEARKVSMLLSRVKAISQALFKLFFGALKAKNMFREEMNRPYGSFFYSHLFTNEKLSDPVFKVHTNGQHTF